MRETLVRKLHLAYHTKRTDLLRKSGTGTFSTHSADVH